MKKFCVILPAAGKSSRFGNLHYKKPFAMLNDRAVWLHSAQRFLNRDDVTQLLLVVAPEDYEEVLWKYQADLTFLGIQVVRGGKERSDSIANAIPHIDPQCDFVCIHDAARPCVTDAWIQDVFEVAERTGAAILGIPLADTIKKIEPSPSANRRKKKALSLDQLIPDNQSPEKEKGDGTILGTLDRTNVWAAQTPQVFRRDWFEEMYAHRSAGNSPLITDDAMLFELAGKHVHVVESSSMNLKITTQDDLKLAEAIHKILFQPRKATFHDL
ncbi:MAG: IspD/TarI family cytidylyltransferase [Planctomycetia bacterium]|nr:IspD/TarI family cytidylyltransferase [Planctomycetia bacterium]